MKTTLKSLPAILISIIVVAGITYAAGSLTAPGTVQNTMYTLTDLYNLSTGATTTVGTGSIPSTPESVSANLYSITEVYDAISDEIIQITPEVLALGTTVFGVEGTLEGGASITWSTDQGTSNHAGAISTCSGTVDGSTGWRLPTVAELLVAESEQQMLMTEDHGLSTFGSYWSRDLYEVEGYAWYIGWRDDVGEFIQGAGDVTDSLIVKCVKP